MNSKKRFYIGTNLDYQLARSYIQQGKGCSISCHRGRGVVPPANVVSCTRAALGQANSAQFEQMDENSARALSWVQVYCSNDASHSSALTWSVNQFEKV